MTDHLVFTLVAPMGSFGGLAGHERRGSHSWPGRSAVLGLIGATLGVRRDDAEGQARLRSLKCAVSVLSDSYPLQDFHTVQTVPSASIKRPATRADALEALKPSDYPVITRRDYRTDCAFGVALWGRFQGSKEMIDEIAEALKTPHFVPYMGRKSCPLSAPMAPRIVLGADVVEALAQVELPPFLPDLTPHLPQLISSDEPLPKGWTETLWDDPLDRDAWHFGPRTVHIKTKGSA